MRLIAVLIAANSLLTAQNSDVIRETLAIQDAIQAGDLATASRLLSDSLTRHPKEGGLFNLRGVVHASRNELPQARKDFEKAVRLAPSLTPAWQNLARACQTQAEQDPSSIPCAVDSWQHVASLNPNNVEAHGSLALLYKGQNRPRDAVAESAEIVKLVEGLDARRVASTADLRQLAIAYEDLNRPSDARKVLERVALQDPNNPSHLLELARLADAAKDYEGALGYLAHARDLAPSDAQIHFLFGIIAAKANLTLEARRSLDRALAIDPTNPSYNYAMGLVILATREAATASVYFEKFVKAKPQDCRGHFALGVAYFDSGEYEKAKVEMLRIADDRQVSGGAEYFLGRIARTEGGFEDASRHLQKSIQMMPAFSESHTELARVLMHEGDLKAARAELDRAIELDPSSFQAHAQLLVLYRRTHDPEAEKQAQILKQLDEERSRRAELMLRTLEFRP